METPSNVDYRILIRTAQREKAALREIGDGTTNAFLMTLLGVGTAVFFGGLTVTFGLLYILNLFVRLID